MAISTDRIRQIASQKYVVPAAQRGDRRIVIKVKELQNDLYQEGFPSGRIPMVCSALRGKKFLQANGLELESVEGPPSGQSTTMVYHYRVAREANIKRPVAGIGSDPARDPLVELRGILKGAIREGAAAFIKELRKDKNKDVAAA